MTAVGATAGPNSNDPLIACQSQEGGIITTGGGFSTYYEAPSWQTAAIANYFSAAEAAGTTPSSGYSPMVCVHLPLRLLLLLLRHYHINYVVPQIYLYG